MMRRFDPEKSDTGLLVLLILVATLAPFSVDAYLPALPQLVVDLASDASTIQLTIGGFLLGSALGSLLAGPLSDAWGRRPVMVAGIVIFAAFSAACALVTQAEWLVVFRFLQALAGGAALLAGRALMGDLYQGDTLARKNSVILLFIAIAPIIGAIIGGWVAQSYGWRWIFWGLTFAAALAVIVTLLKLPETLDPQQREPLRLLGALRGYASVFLNPIASMYMFAAGLMSAVFFAYVAATPFLYIETYGMSVSNYSVIFALGALAAVLANWFNILSISKLGYRHTFLFQGLLAMSIGTLVFAGGFGLLGHWAIIVPGLLFMPLMHVFNSNAITGVMDQFETRKGTAAACVTSLRFGFGMVGVAVVSVFQGSIEIRYALILFVFSALAGVCAQMAVRWDT